MFFKKAPMQILFASVFLFLFLTFSCTKEKALTVYQNGVVSTAAPIATEVGMEVFKSGGNAFDVAVAVGFTLAVVHPQAGNIGGGGFAVIRDGATGEIKALDFREKAPAAAHEKMYLDSAGDVIANLSTIGALSTGVPGTVAGLYELWSKYGTLEWADLVGITSKLADTGVIIDQYESNHLKKYQEKLNRFAETAALFFPNGKPLEPGERFIQKDLSLTLNRIAENGPEAFYKGEIAGKIVATMKKHNGIITRDDLANYTVVWRSPIHFTFDSLDIYSMPPPSSGGIIVGEILKIIEPYDFSAYNPASPEYIHLFCEAARLAYADRSEHLGDPDFYEIPDFLLNEKYLKERAFLINLNRANLSADIKPGIWNDSESKQTTHFSIADKDGNLVSITYTLNSSYGSKLIVEGTGFLLNNEMDDFAIAPGHANLYGLVGNEANKVEPNKRMLSSMSPTIVLKNNKPFLILGSPGGSEIITSVAQTILNFTRFNLTLDKSLKQPRIHHQWLPDKIKIEKNSFDIHTKQGLIRMGHIIEEVEIDSEINAVHIADDGRMTGAADPRKRGTAGGF